MKEVNRAVVFVHYDKDNLVDDYVYYYLRELKNNASNIVFVSTASLSSQAIFALEKYCAKVIVRENKGHDFMSYKIGLDNLEYQKYDEVVICNDSVYGPFYPLSTLFDTMKDTSCDFWGITDNTDMSYHLQSYFLVFNKSVLSHSCFSEFWAKVKILNDKEEIIEKYEVGLTQFFQKEGFTATAYIDFQATKVQRLMSILKKFSPHKIFNKITAILKKEYTLKRIGKLNATLYFWEELIIKHKMPFIKIKLLRDNPNNIDIDKVEEVLTHISTYDTNLIKNHLTRMEV